MRSLPHEQHALATPDAQGEGCTCSYQSCCCAAAVASTAQTHMQHLANSAAACRRDAHQSLLATRVRTHDLVRAAEPTAHLLAPLGSLECW